METKLNLYVVFLVPIYFDFYFGHSIPILIFLFDIFIILVWILGVQTLSCGLGGLDFDYSQN